MTVRDLTVVHSSDLHIDATRATDEFHPLCRVLATARDAAADVLVLAGDIFDHNRLPLTVLDKVSRLLADSGLRVVILPGNHDCLSADSVYRRGGIAAVTNVQVLGVDAEAFTFPDLDLEVWGRAHFDYKNLSPLAEARPRAAPAVDIPFDPIPAIPWHRRYGRQGFHQWVLIRKPAVR